MHAQRDKGTYAFIPTRVSLSHQFENAHCNAAAVTLFAGLELELVTEVVWEKNSDMVDDNTPDFDL